MKILRGCSLFALVIAATPGVCTTAAVAQQPFPSRPITIIVPLDVGSVMDTLGRAMSKPLADRYGVPVVIENRPGANFVIAASVCAKARPDGHTLCFLPRDTISILPFEGPVPYDPLKDFVPVANLVWNQSVLVVNASLPVNTFKELVAYSRKNPNTLNATAFGSAQLSMEWIKKQTGADMTFVPFKGSPAALQAFLGGQVQVFYASTAAPGLLGMIKSGKARALMVPGDARNALLPEVPAATEVGLPNFSISTWMGMFSPAGTPLEAVAKLSAGFVAVIAEPEIRNKSLLPLGMAPIGMPHDEFARLIAKDMKEGAELVRIVGPRVR